MLKKRAYRLVAHRDGPPGIECLKCGTVSWSRQDIENKYCARCNAFHDVGVPDDTSDLDDPLTPDQDAQARQRTNQVAMRLREHRDEMQRLSERAQREANPKQKIIWLWRLTQPLKAATAGIAACKEGCSHCCYTPVPMHYTEAQVIAEHAKQEMTVPDSYVMEPNMKYVGTPCPFLKNDKCSIYSSRPFACRVHYNMDRDESRCVLGNKPKTVPYFNRRPYDMAYVSAIGLDDLRYADIRDFFPS